MVMKKAMATQEGTQVAYNYYKAYEEALKKVWHRQD